MYYMKTSDAIEYAGGSLKLARLLGLSSGAISQWGEYPPAGRQLQIEKITSGKLAAENDCLYRLMGFKKPDQVPA